MDRDCKILSVMCDTLQKEN